MPHHGLVSMKHALLMRCHQLYVVSYCHLGFMPNLGKRAIVRKGKILVESSLHSNDEED